MSRGWESKSVESQQSDMQQPEPAPEPAASSPRSAIRGNSLSDAEQKRRLQALQLQRERILSERTASPHRRSALTNALATIEEELAQLGWTVHL